MTVAYTEVFASFNPASSGSFQDYDAFTNQGIPKGAVIEIVAGNLNASTDVTMGFRIKGSALNRYRMLHEAEAGGVSCMTWYVKSDANGYIQYYTSTTTAVTFYILGYWTGVDFTEEHGSITAATTNWEDETLSTASRVFAITAFSRLETAALTMGVRANGGAAGNRYIVVHECENTGNGGTAFTFLVKSDASAIIDIYTSATATGTFYSQGYFGADLDFVEGWTRIQQTSSGNWQDNDLTAYMDQDGRTVSFILCNGEVGTENNEGVRNNDQVSGNRYILVHESEDAALAGDVEFNGYTATSTTDASGLVELFSTDSAHEYFMLQGYFTYAPPPTYALTGVTKDKDGEILISCECFLCKDNGDSTATFIAHTVSDGATGVYEFTGLTDDDAQYFVISWRDDSPHVFDVTDRVLQPLEE